MSIKSIREFGVVRGLNALVNVCLLLIIMLGHLWTPIADIVHLYNGFEIVPHAPIFLVVPLMNLAALYLLFNRRYSKKLWRVGLLGWSILYNIAIFWGQSVFLNGSNDSPTPNGWLLAGLIIFMLVFVVISLIGAVKNPNRHPGPAADLPNPTKGPSSEFGQNPFTALGQGFWALRLNWLPITAFTLISIAVSSVQRFVSKSTYAAYFHNLWPSLGLGLLVLIVSIIINVIVFVLTIASAQNRKLTFSEALSIGFRRLGPFIWTCLLMYIFIVFGFMLFIIPGIIVSFRLLLAPNILLDSGVGPWQAIKLSNRLMKKNAMQTIGVVVIIGILFSGVVVTVFFGPWISIIASVPVLAAILSANVYFNRLYHRLDALKQDGFTRLRVHWANIVLLVVGILFAIAAPIGLVIFSGLSGKAAQVTYDTACFQVTLPDFYHVDNNAANCRLTATTGDKTLVYEPVIDTATSAEQLAKDLKTSQYPSPRYTPFLGLAPNTDSIDGQDTQTYSLWDTTLGENASVSYVNTAETFIISGKQVRNFELIDHATKAQNNNYPSFEEDFNPVDITTTIVWPPYGSSDYQNALNAASDDLNSQKYDQAITDAKTAASLADNDYARSLAFSTLGDAYAWNNNNQAATADYQEALTLSQNNPDALDGMATMFYDSNNYPQTISYANKALALDDTYADAYDLLGLSYLEEHNNTAAVQNAEKAVKLDPTSDTYQSDLQHILNPNVPAGSSSSNVKT